MKNFILIISAAILFIYSTGCTKNKKTVAEPKSDTKDVVVSDSIKSNLDEYSEEYKLGNTTIHIDVTEKEGKYPLKYFNMHEDEVTSVKAGKYALETSGGMLIKLRAKGTRNITFYLGDEKYTFDPNRIYTEAGLERTLNNLGNYSNAAFNRVSSFVDHIFGKFFKDSGQVIIALHNNTPGAYSLASYMRGGEEEKNAKDVYNNSDMSLDDFFVVTDETLFIKLKEKKMNVVLQNNENAFDDGSLSIYCGQKGIMYVNVEAQRNHLGEQKKMLEVLYNVFEDILKK